MKRKKKEVMAGVLTLKPLRKEYNKNKEEIEALRVRRNLFVPKPKANIVDTYRG